MHQATAKEVSTIALMKFSFTNVSQPQVKVFGESSFCKTKLSSHRVNRFSALL
jgi:hypothetical protein